MSLRLSAYHVASQPFLDENDGVIKRLVFSTRTATVVIIPEKCWIATRNANLAALPKSMVAELCEIELLVPADTDDPFKFFSDPAFIVHGNVIAGITRRTS